MKKAILQKGRGTMSNQSVSLHLSEAHTAMPLPSLNGLVRERVHRPCGTDLGFVGYL